MGEITSDSPGKPLATTTGGIRPLTRGTAARASDPPTWTLPTARQSPAGKATWLPPSLALPQGDARTCADASCRHTTKLQRGNPGNAKGPKHAEEQNAHGDGDGHRNVVDASDRVTLANARRYDPFPSTEKRTPANLASTNAAWALQGSSGGKSRTPMMNCKELIAHGRDTTANHKQPTASQSFVENGTTTRRDRGCDGAAACGCHGACLRALEEGEVASLAADEATAFQRWGVTRPPTKLSPIWRSLVQNR